MDENRDLPIDSKEIKIEYLAVEKKVIVDSVEKPHYDEVYQRQLARIDKLKEKLAEKKERKKVAVKNRIETAKLKQYKKTRSTIVIDILSSLSTKTNNITGVSEKKELEYWMHLAQIQKALEGDTNAYKVIMDNAYKPHALEIEQKASTPDLSEFSDEDLRKFLSEGE